MASSGYISTISRSLRWGSSFQICGSFTCTRFLQTPHYSSFPSFPSAPSHSTYAPTLLWIFGCTMKPETLLIKSNCHEAETATSWQELVIESTEDQGRWREWYTRRGKEDITDSQSFFWSEWKHASLTESLTTNKGHLVALLTSLILQVFNPTYAWVNRPMENKLKSTLCRHYHQDQKLQQTAAWGVGFWWWGHGASKSS